MDTITVMHPDDFVEYAVYVTTTCNNHDNSDMEQPDKPMVVESSESCGDHQPDPQSEPSSSPDMDSEANEEVGSFCSVETSQDLPPCAEPDQETVEKSPTLPDTLPELLPTPSNHNEVTAEGGHDLSGGKFLPFLAVLQELLSTTGEALPYIPQGTKNNVYFIIDNSSNHLRRAQGLRSEFVDDCGAWSHSPSPVYYFTQNSSGKYSPFVRRNDKYCMEKTNKGRRTFVPLDPQPAEESIIRLQRNYNTLKADSSYKRRVTWMEPSERKVALVEYVGSFPGAQPHGNAKKKKVPTATLR